MAQPVDSVSFRHPNGHVTAMAHYGDINGQPVFYFHGLPSSRLEGALLHEAAVRAGAHIIAVDRPGIGLSSVMPGRTLLSWPALVSELAEYLGFAQFYVLGSSAGGPYALACAKMLPPQQLKGVGVVAGMSPVALGLGGMTLGGKFTIYITKLMPWLGRILYDWTVIPAAQNPDTSVFEKIVTDGFSALSETDKRLFEDEQLKALLVQAAREHFRQGNKGLMDEWRIFVSGWGFDLDTIEQENVLLWCGTKDVITPIELSRRMASRIKHATLTEFAGDTHYSILVVRMEQILRELLHCRQNVNGHTEHRS